MLKFEVKDMSCGHCAGSITRAIKEVDPQADVNVDLDGKVVSINTNADAAKIKNAIDEAGFTPAALPQ